MRRTLIVSAPRPDLRDIRQISNRHVGMYIWVGYKGDYILGETQLEDSETSLK